MNIRPWLLLLLVFNTAFSCFAGSGRYFQEIRKAAQKVRRGSAEDLALGEKLMQEVRQLALTRKPALPRPYLITESVIFRSARLWYTDKIWRDRQLFADRRFWDKNHFAPASLSRSFELMKLSGIDAVNFFMGDVVRERPYDALKQMGEKGADFYIVPTLLPNVHLPGGEASKLQAKLPKTPYLKRAFSSRHTLRFNGRPLVLAYGADKRPPHEIAAFFKAAEKAGQARIACIADIDGNGIKLWPEIEFAHTKKIRATSVLRYFDHLYKHLATADGIEYAYYSGNQRRHLAYEYYDQILMPLFAAACAAEPYNGKKILAWKVVQGYFNCNASQTLDADGTKTLRGYLELCRKHKVDLLCTFEWDETNENTNIEPTVSKPMAHARILKYWTDQVRGKKPVPFPGDDLSVPGLIVSSNRMLSCGQEYELELLNIPDGTRKAYSLRAEVTDQNGQTVFSSGILNFDASVMQDKTLRFPTNTLPHTTLLQPRLILLENNTRRTVSGLPPTVLRGTVTTDYSWFSTPLRNLLKPEKEMISFKEAGLSPSGNRLVDVSVDLRFPEPLSAVEIIQNTQDLFAFDPRNEFGQNDKDMHFFKLSFRMMDQILLHKFRLSCPGAVFFDFPALNQPARQHKDTLEGRVREGRWCHDRLFKIPASKLKNAVLTVSGTRLSGKYKGQKYEWKIKLFDAVLKQVLCQVFPDTLSLTLEHRPKALLLPLALNRKDARFSTQIAVSQPDAMLALRVVSTSGKVWWSKAHAPDPAGKMMPVAAFSDLKGIQYFQLPAGRVADIRYDFNDPLTGSILPAAAGRDFYANAGGPIGTAIGFEGGMAGQIAPAVCAKAGTPPVWSRQSDGRRALLFDGKHTTGLFLPNTFLPSRNGFKMILEITPYDIRKRQILFEQIGAAGYLNGFRLSVTGGHLEIEYASHTPDRLNSPLSRSVKKRTGLTLQNNKRQKIEFAWNGKQIKLQINGKAEFIPADGIPRWLTISAFGGRNTQKFTGLLHQLSAVHSPGF